MTTRERIAGFMERAMALERSQTRGRELLDSFQQNLELFGRPQVRERSPLLQEIFARNWTPRLARYAEAGCRHSSCDKRVIAELNSSMEGLHDHVEQGWVLLEELQRLLNAMVSEGFSSLEPQEDESELLKGTGQEEAITMAALVFSMLKEDHEMQRRIVEQVGLETPSDILQNYCTIWGLRPFLDEQVLAVAFRRTREAFGSMPA